MKHFFSDKNNPVIKLTRIENDATITDDTKIAETFNKYFSDGIKNVEIRGFQTKEILVEIRGFETKEIPN